MDKGELALIERLKSGNPVLARHWNDHQEFERQLATLQRKAHLSSEEERELKRLKKLKLAGRDEIARILAGHRDGA